MNKKILALALVFVSASLFLGCSADASFASNKEPPAWNNALDSDPGTGTDTGGENEAGYCLFYEYGEYNCEPLPQGFTAQDCIYYDGTPVSSCSGY